MRTSKFTKQQRLEILAKLEVGTSINELCRDYQVSAATLHLEKGKGDRG